MSTYYAVREGHKRGIFRTWAEAKAATDHYSSPEHRKFFRLEDAEAFMRGEEPRKIETPEPHEMEAFLAFHEARMADRKPCITHRGQTLRVLATPDALSMARLAKAMDYPFTKSARLWLRCSENVNRYR